MKAYKRLLALLLAAAMVFSLASTAFAADISTAQDSSEVLTDDAEADSFEETMEELPSEIETETAEELSPLSETPAEEDLSDTSSACVEEDAGLLTAAAPEAVEEDEDDGLQKENSWRFKDGEMIYPDASASGDLVEEGTALYNSPTGSLTASGIDISHWQGDINWAKASTAVDYVIIGCGRVVYDASNKLINKVDEKLSRNISECKKYGVPMGFYIYSYGHDAKREANLILNQLSAAGLTPKDVSFPIYLDLEDSSLVSKSSEYYMTNAQILSYTTTFCSTIEAAGYTAGIYANEDWWKTYLKDSKYNNWERWLARWGAINYSGSWSMWQYTSSGTVSGISGRVDMDHWYGALPYGSLSTVTPTVTSFYNGASGITIKWNRIAQATGYYVYRKTGDGSYTKLATLSSPCKISYTDTTAVEGTKYSYYIKAYNQTSSSKNSTTKTITRVGSPTVSVVNTANGLDVSWSAVKNATLYHVYRHDDSTTDWTEIAQTDSDVLKLSDNDVLPGVFYTYSVIATAGTTNGGRNVAINPVPRLTTPVVTIGNSTNATSGMLISWEAVPGAEGYLVWRREKPTDSWARVATLTDASTLSFIDTTAVDGTAYYYTVRANVGDVRSATSSCTAPVLYMAAPAYSLSNTDTGIKVTWTAAKVADQYRIYRKSPSDTKWQLMTKESAEATAWTDTTAAAGTTYRYAVRPCYEGLLGCFYTSGKYMCRLITPTVTVSNTTTGQKISWDKIPGAAGYYIYKRTSSSASWSKFKTITSGSTVSYTNTSVTNNTGYYYTVRAYKDTYTSTYKSASKLLFLTTPTATLTNTSTGMKVSWTKITGAAGYYIYRSTSSSGTYTKIGSTSSASFTDTTAKVGTTYYYRVYAYNGTAKSSYKTVSKKRS